MKTERKRSHKNLKITFAIGATLFLISLNLVSSQQILGFELGMFRHINNWPDSLNTIFLAITYLGSAWMLFLVTLICIRKKFNRLAVRVFGVGVVGFLVSEILKLLVERPRPPFILINVNVREHLIGMNGYPSGHVTVATIVGLLLLPILSKNWQKIVLALIMLVGLSRIYLGAHAPYDVVGGFALGLMLVSGSQLIRNKLKTVTKITHLKLTD